MPLDPCPACHAPIEGAGFFSRRTHTKECTVSKDLEKMIKLAMPKGQPAVLLPNIDIQPGGGNLIKEVHIQSPCQLCLSKVPMEEIDGAKGHSITPVTSSDLFWVPCTPADRKRVEQVAMENRARAKYKSVVSG